MIDDRVGPQRLDRLHQKAEATGDGRDACGMGGIDIEMRIADKNSVKNPALV